MKKQKQETKDSMVDESNEKTWFDVHPSTINSPSFNLQEYEKQFSGYGKIHRLLHIADKCPEHSLEAFRCALREVKRGYDTKLYQDIYTKALDKHKNFGVDFDDKWVSQTNKSFNERNSKLESALQAARKDGERESCAEALLNSALYLLERGDYHNALSKLVEAREFAPPSSTDLYILTIRAAFPINSFAHIKSSASRLKISVEKDSPPQDKKLSAQANAVLGLAHLKCGSFSSACQHFLQVTSDLGSSLNEIISPAEVGVYGLLTALASLQRSDFQQQVLSNSEFRRFMDLNPTLKQFANDFHQAKFKTAFTSLQQIMNDLYLDVNLYSCLNRLVRSIRDHALVSMTKPYLCVRLSSLADSLCLTEVAVEHVLFELIAEKRIQARIDAHNKLVIATSQDEVKHTFQQAVCVGTRFMREAQAILLRMACIEADLTIKPEGKKTQTSSSTSGQSSTEMLDE